MTKARITYRFDENGHVNQKSEDNERENRSPDVTIYDTQPLNQMSMDYGAWNSSFDIETQNLEELIRNSNRSPYGNGNNGSKSHSWDDELFKNDVWDEANDVDYESGYIDPNTRKLNYTAGDRDIRGDTDWQGFDPVGPVYDKSFTRKSYIKRRGTPPWFKIAASAGGAVITGILFGAFVLSMFASNESLLEVVTPEQTIEQQETSPPVLDAAESQTIPENLDIPNTGVTSEQAGTIQVTIPQRSYFVLQNGMFSEIDGAEQAIQQLQLNGFTGVYDKLENYYVYAGITINRDDALFLSHQLQENGLETYIKSLEMPVATAIQWNGSAGDSFDTYVAEGTRLVEMISNISLLHLAGSQPTTLDNSTVAALKTTHQNWTQVNASVSKGLPERALPLHQNMVTAINTAMLSMEEYQKNPSHAYLWQAQKAVIQYVLTERQLLTAIGA